MFPFLFFKFWSHCTFHCSTPLVKIQCCWQIQLCNNVSYFNYYRFGVCLFWNTTLTWKFQFCASSSSKIGCHGVVQAFYHWCIFTNVSKYILLWTHILEILFNMIVNKKKIEMQDGFEGLLKYYVKLTSTWFIEQWVTLKFYNELLSKIFSSCVTLLNGDKNCLNFWWVYRGGERSSKMWFSHHKFKGCLDAPIDLRTNNPIYILVFPNFINV